MCANTLKRTLMTCCRILFIPGSVSTRSYIRVVKTVYHVHDCVTRTYHPPIRALYSFPIFVFHSYISSMHIHRIHTSTLPAIYPPTPMRAWRYQKGTCAPYHSVAVCACACVRACACTCACMCVCVCACVHARARVCTYTCERHLSA